MDFWKWFVPGMKVKRWLACLFAGMSLLALGVGYVLRQLYDLEVQFPSWVYYATLQFLPRLVRAGLFLLLGVGLIVLALNRLTGTLLQALAPQRDRSLAEMVYSAQRSERGKRVVVIGGSTGTMLLLRALRQPGRDLHVRVITTGLESSRIFSRIEEELHLSSGRVLFPTREDAAVYAELEDGSFISGTDAIAAPGKAPIRCVFLGRKIKEAGVIGDGFRELAQQSQAALEPNPEAIEAVERADLIVLGPASLYTGILPCLTPPIVEALRRSRAAKLFLCNIMTEPGQTDGYSVSAHLRALYAHAGTTPDFVLVNTATVSERVLARYRQANAEPLLYNPAVDRPSSSLSFEGAPETILVEGAILLQRDLVAEIRDDIPVVVDGHTEKRSMVVIRHDDEKLAGAIAELMERQLAWGYSA
jgi:2-phospho-L-lactate transferase/gluconeogenesis factor (CofD/UPF0052 family)